MLGDRRAAWLAAALGFLLFAPALTSGLQFDDLNHRATLRPIEGLSELERSPLDLFVFVDGAPETARAAMDRGLTPWFMDEHLRLSFFRPISGLSHALDFRLWPEQHWLMHLHSLLVVRGSEFKTITQSNGFPAYLSKNVIKDSILQYYCNGEIGYKLKNVHVKATALWKYKAPEGTGDTYYSLMKGTKATLLIDQGQAEQYKPTLYIKPAANTSEYEAALHAQFKKIEQQHPGVELKKINDGWQVVIPEKESRYYWMRSNCCYLNTPTYR